LSTDSDMAFPYWGNLAWRLKRFRFMLRVRDLAYLQPTPNAND